MLSLESITYALAFALANFMQVLLLLVVSIKFLSLYPSDVSIFYRFSIKYLDFQYSVFKVRLVIRRGPCNGKISYDSNLVLSSC